MEESLGLGSVGEEGQKGPELPENLIEQSGLGIPEEDMQRAHLYARASLRTRIFTHLNHHVVN